MMTAKYTAKIRLYPGNKEKDLIKSLECCRFVYNQTLENMINTYDETGKIKSYFDLNKELPKLRSEYPELKNAHSHILNDAMKRVTLSMAGFFRRVKNHETPGFPRFKSKNRYDSFTYTQYGDYKILENHYLQLGKIGNIHYKGNIQKEYLKYGRPKTCTIKRKPTGKWYAYIVFEFDDYGKGTFTFTEKKDAGVDLNIKNLATVSDGTVYENSRLLERSLHTIADIQKKMSKHEKGSAKYQKYKKQLAHAYERLNNRRNDEAHKISRELVDDHSGLAFEDLDIQGMIDNTDIPNITRAFYSVAWRRIMTYTEYKAEEAGIPFVKVDPAYTSQICSECGNMVPKTLDERIHHCDVCGLTMSRDQNAALNILKRAWGTGLCHPEG